MNEAEENFQKFLLENENIPSTMGYWECSDRFGHLDVNTLNFLNIWNSVETNNTRKSVFRRAMSEKAVLERNREYARMIKINEILIETTHETTWKMFEELMRKHPDPDITNADKANVLRIFQDHILALQEEHEEEEYLKVKKQGRQARHNRDNFLGLLEELHKDGKLTSMSTWKELYPMISTDKRFEALLHQTGSDPLLLFKLHSRNLKKRFSNDRKTIIEILNDKSFQLQLTTAYADFKSLVLSDARSCTFDPCNVELTFYSLMEKLELEEKIRVKETKKRQKKMDSALISTFKAKAVDGNMKWEKARSLVENEPSFLAVTEESDRERIFRAYVHSIQNTCSHNHVSSSKRKKRKKIVEIVPNNNLDEASSAEEFLHRRRRFLTYKKKKYGRKGWKSAPLSHSSSPTSSACSEKEEDRGCNSREFKCVEKMIKDCLETFKGSKMNVVADDTPLKRENGGVSPEGGSNRKWNRGGYRGGNGRSWCREGSRSRSRRRYSRSKYRNYRSDSRSSSRRSRNHIIKRKLFSRSRSRDDRKISSRRWIRSRSKSRSRWRKFSSKSQRSRSRSRRRRSRSRSRWSRSRSQRSRSWSRSSSRVRRICSRSRSFSRWRSRSRSGRICSRSRSRSKSENTWRIFSDKRSPSRKIRCGYSDSLPSFSSRYPAKDGSLHTNGCSTSMNNGVNSFGMIPSASVGVEYNYVHVPFVYEENSMMRGEGFNFV